MPPIRRHAVAPECAAAAILKGIRCNRYLVFTSPDIRLLHWVQRKFSLPYEIIMRVMNDLLSRAAGVK